MLKEGDYIHQYKVECMIGRGGFSEVYKVLHIKYNMFFAAKIIMNNGDQVQQEKNLEEFYILKSLDHPNIVRIYDFFEEKHFIVLILEYCVQGSLQDKIEREGPLGIEKTIFIGKQLINALEYLHHRSIAHHDIKPQNVLLCQNDVVKLADYGTSLLCIYSHMSRDHRFTKKFAPPEALNNSPMNVFLGDIYSLGYTLLCTLFGFRIVLLEDSNYVKNPQNKLEEIIHVMLSKEAEDRKTASMHKKLFDSLPNIDHKQKNHLRGTRTQTIVPLLIRRKTSLKLVKI